MKSIITLFFTALTFTVAGTSCIKNQSENDTASEADKKLVNTKWKITAQYSYPLSNPASQYDEFQTWKSCDKDDIYHFESYDHLKRYSGNTKCEASENSMLGEIGWYFTENDKTLVLRNAEYRVLEFSENKLQLEGYQSDGRALVTTYDKQ